VKTGKLTANSKFASRKTCMQLCCGMEELDLETTPSRLPALLLLILAIMAGGMAFKFYRQAKMIRAEAAALRLEGEKAQSEAAKAREDAKLRELAAARELGDLRKRLATSAPKTGDADSAGDVLFAYNFADGLDAFRSSQASPIHYVGTEGEKLVIGQHRRVGGMAQITTRSLIRFPVGASARLWFSARPAGIEQYFGVSFIRDAKSVCKVDMKRTPWGWLPAPDKLVHMPGRPGPNGPVTMIIERATGTQFRFYYDAGEGPILMGLGDQPSALGLETCVIYIGGWSSQASGEAHFFARDLDVSASDFARKNLQGVTTTPFSKASDLSVVERHILLPATSASVQKGGPKRHLFSFTTPNYTEENALLFFGLHNAADDSGDGGMTWRLSNSDGVPIRSGYKKNKNWWRWMAIEAAPNTGYRFEVKDADTVFGGDSPGNGAWAGAYLACYGKSPQRVVDQSPRMLGAAAVDLLPLIDVARDGLTGQWERAGDGLKQLDTSRGRQMLRLPIGVGEAYELELEFTRLEGDGPISMQFPVGSRNPGFSLDAPAPAATRHSAIVHVRDPGVAKISNPTVVKAPPLELGKRYRFNLRVATTGDVVDITAELDGTPLTAWRGEIAKVTEGFSNSVPYFSRTAAIGIRDGSIHFHTVRLLPFK
jgi:hypothetical protein